MASDTLNGFKFPLSPDHPARSISLMRILPPAAPQISLSQTRLVQCGSWRTQKAPLTSQNQGAPNLGRKKSLEVILHATS